MGYPQDTNETLRQARVALSQVRALDEGLGVDDLADGYAEAVRLAAAFEALDGALSTGAPIPDAWTKGLAEFEAGLARIERLADIPIALSWGEALKLLTKIAIAARAVRASVPAWKKGS